MKKYPIKTVSSFAIMPCGIAVFFLSRMGAYRLLTYLFSSWNVTYETYAYAPAWARTLADVSSAIPDMLACAVSILCTILIFRLTKKKLPKAGRMKQTGISLCAGAGLAAALLGILLLTDSIRMPFARAWRPAQTACTLLSEALLCAWAALLLRGTLPVKKIGILALALSAVLEMLLCAWLYGKFEPVLMLNAALFGVAAVHMLAWGEGFLPEAAFAFGFRAVERIIFGYPDLGGAYWVSETFLTGASDGLEAGAALSILTALALILKFVFKKYLNINRTGGDHHAA